MNKSDLIAALGSINDRELVLLRLPDGSMLAIDSVEIQQDEAPIFGIVVTADLGKGEFKQIADERLAAKEREQEAEAERARQEADGIAAAAEAGARQEAALQAKIDQAVEAALAAKTRT